MERGNPVVSPGVPSQVRMSVVPDPETTRGRSGDKSQFRDMVESKTSEKKEEKEQPVEEEEIFERQDEPVVKGTIVITVYKNHPYGVEFSGDIRGADRDIAWRAMMKGYIVWKAGLAKKQEQAIKLAEAKKKEEEDNARD